MPRGRRNFFRFGIIFFHVRGKRRK
jgi:hypothetical protein